MMHFYTFRIFEWCCSLLFSALLVINLSNPRVFNSKNFILWNHYSLWKHSKSELFLFKIVIKRLHWLHKTLFDDFCSIKTKCIRETIIITCLDLIEFYFIYKRCINPIFHWITFDILNDEFDWNSDWNITHRLDQRRMFLTDQVWKSLQIISQQTLNDANIKQILDKYLTK